MAKKQIISRESLQTLMDQLKEAFATKEETTGAFKGVKYEGNKLSFYSDKSAAGGSLVEVDLPKEMYLDNVKTKFEPSFEWNEETYSGAVNPQLNGKSVLVLAIKDETGAITYSFLDMSTLADTYIAAEGDKSTNVEISGYTIAVKVNKSKEPNNALEIKEDGLYVPTVDISGKLNTVDGTNGNLTQIGEDGQLADSNLAAADILTIADIQDFTEMEIKTALGLIPAE